MKSLAASPPVRIVHVSSAHPWTDNRIHYRECASLKSNGYEVHLIGVESTVRAEDSGVRVVALPRLPRLQRVLIGSVRAVNRALKTKAVVFHLHDPELLWAIPLLRLLGKKVIFDAHEDLPVQVASKEYLGRPAKFVMTVLAHGAIALARSSNCVIAATETIAKRFPAKKVFVVHNYPPLRDIEATAPSVLARQEQLVYVGAIGVMRGALKMVNALGSDSFPRGWRLQLAGAVSPELEARMRESVGWANVDFHGAVPPDQARDIVLSSRVGLVVLQGSLAYRESLPTKMFEYFASGVPVIASDFPLWRSIIEQFDCGLLVNEESPDAIAQAIATYASDPELLERHSRNARKAATDVFNWAEEVPTLLAAYQKVLSP